MTALKVDVIELRKDIDQLKSMDFSMLFRMLEIPEMSSTDIPSSYQVPSATTTGDVPKVDDVDIEFEAETYEEHLGV